jgi:enoyl-CoA hydratase
VANTASSPPSSSQSRMVGSTEALQTLSQVALGGQRSVGRSENVDQGELEYASISYEVVDRVAIVSMRRPPVNAVSQAMYQEIRDLFSRVDEVLPGIAAVILRGEGKHFSAGNDLDEFMSLTPTNSPGRMKTVREAFAAIYDCPVPVIAAVHGYAVGTGVALAGSCDLVICGESAHFGTPEVGVGVMGGAKHLSRLVPQQVARLMYFTADPVPAAEIIKYGGVVCIVPDSELLDAARGLAKRIVRHSTVALRAAKESLNTIEYMELKSGYEFEQRLTARLSGTAESREARAAIAEKREPIYEEPDRPVATPTTSARSADN